MKTTTRNLEGITDKQILSVDSPELLFSRWEIKAEYRTLAKRWHPDAGGRSDVFQKISALYAEGLELIDQAKWKDPPEKIETIIPNRKLFQPLHGKQVQLRYRRRHDFELGEMYVGNTVVCYVVRKEFKDLFNNGVRRVKHFPFKDSTVRDEMTKKFLPRYLSDFETASELVLVVEKNHDQLYLPDVMAHIKQLDPIGHIGWFVNVLLNMSCYMQTHGICNNGIELRNFFVSPPNHTGILGSWWYSTERGEKLLALPEKSMNYFPADVVRQKIADNRGDLDCVRALAREVLGDITGATLQWNNSIPKAISRWLMGVSSGDAIEDYRYWKKTVLIEAFGKPRYVAWDLGSHDLYK